MRSFILGCLLVGSIILNIATMTVTGVATVVSGLFESVTGIGTVLGAVGEGLSSAQTRLANTEAELKSTKAKNVELAGEIDNTKARSVKLDGALKTEKKKTSSLVAELNGTNKKNASLLQEVADLKGEKLVVYRGNKRLLKDAVGDASRRISTRTATGATRNLAATFGEAWPVAGTAVIVTATTLELYDACVIMQDIHELDVAFNPDAAFGAEVQEVCGLRVPTAEEIWAKVKNSPGEAWSMAKAVMPELPEMPKFSMPEMPEVNWSFWN